MDCATNPPTARIKTELLADVKVEAQNPRPPMLRSLRIENFALIEDLTLQFGSGLNVLTGETGAGKSIILDAIDLILGGKISNRILRSGTSRTVLEASFELDASLKDWLQEVDIDVLEEDVLICSREVSNPQGNLRSRSRVNGVVVNKQCMEQLRDRLVEITAQGQAIQLGRASTQRDWLDAFGGAPLLKEREAVATAFAQFQQAQQALDHYCHNEQQRLQHIDLLQYQLDELHQAGLSDPDEQDRLEQEWQRLSHSVELQQQSYQVFQMLYEQTQGLACADQLGQAVTTLTAMNQVDSQIQPILDMAQQALTQVQEAGRQINAYSSTLETDPHQLQQVEARINQLQLICRKYGPTLQDAIAYQTRSEQELADLTHSEQTRERLEQTCQQRQAALQKACARLTRHRQAAARDLEARLLAELKPLAMDAVQFQVDLESIPLSIHGADQILFLFSPNPGEPLQSLAKTASGGEMSRFLLALKACFSQIDAIGTLVFDEIDVGVSGRVAQAIAQKLHQLSQDRQVLCVTHQPIVAAMAHHHYRVAKRVIHYPSSPKPSANGTQGKKHQERTVVQVTALDHQQRRQELAQIAGGHGTEASAAEGVLTFVDSLLDQASRLRHEHQTGRPGTDNGQPVAGKRRRRQRSQGSS